MMSSGHNELNWAKYVHTWWSRYQGFQYYDAAADTSVQPIAARLPIKPALQLADKPQSAQPLTLSN